ncbi:MAG: peptidylprolyl isomerase, partial [Gammaproteobacteria bacterium]
AALAAPQEAQTEPVPDAAPAVKGPQVSIKTTMGEIVLQLDEERAPKTVANFLDHVRKCHYDGTIFHRVIPGFMIQGGGFEPGMAQKPTGAPIPNEADNGLRNDNYTVAMARTSDPHSATAQFFINTVDNASLNHPQPDGHGYAVFGKVIRGMDVVDKIRAVPTRKAGPYSDVPVDPVVIESISRIGAPS